MTRRPLVLLVTLAFGLLVVPFVVEAQPPAQVPRIGLLSLFSPALGESKAESFRQGLRDVSYMEGQHIVIESQWAEGHRERLAELAADLVRMQVAVIVTESIAAALAAKQATHRIPIVMATGSDPMGVGLVASLARPGGNVTGLTFQAPGLSGKRLELLKEAAPQTTLAAVLWNATNPVHAGILGETEAAARALGLQVHAVAVHSPAELDRAFEAIASTRPSALITFGDGMFTDNIRRLVAFAAQSQLPAIFPDREFAEAGGLIIYGAPSATLNDKSGKPFSYHVIAMKKFMSARIISPNAKISAIPR